MSKHISLPLLLLAAMVLLVTPAAAFSGSGAGTSEDPYQITTPAQFLEMRDTPMGYYVLMNDLNMAGNPWSGTIETMTDQITIGKLGPFQLDGAGHKVSNLVITRNYYSTGSDVPRLYYGMFHSPLSNYETCFKNIVMVNPSISFTTQKNGYAGVFSPNPIANNMTFDRVGIVNASLHITHTYDGNSRGLRVYGFPDAPRIYDCYFTGQMAVTGYSTEYSRATMRAFYNPKTPVYASCSLVTTNAERTDVTPIKTTSFPCYYDSTKFTDTVTEANVTGKTTAQLKDQTTFDGWDFTNTWAMSDMDSPLAGMPVPRVFTSYYTVGVPSDLFINAPDSSHVGLTTTIVWSDDAPGSTQTDYLFCMTAPNTTVVYSSTDASGLYRFTPDAVGTWNATFSCSDNEGITASIPVATYIPAELSLTVPETPVLVNTPFQFTWADEEEDSSSTYTGWYLIAPNGTVVNSTSTATSLSRSETVTITPRVVGTWTIDLCDSFTNWISDTVTVRAYVPADLRITMPASAYVGLSEVAVSWADVITSDSTNYVFTLVAPNTTVVYTSATESGTHTFTPDVIGTWTAVFACSDGSVNKTCSVTVPGPSVLNLTVSPTGIITEDTTEVTLSWADHESSEQTGHTLTLKKPNGATAYTSATKTGEYVFTPDTAGDWNVTFTCSDATVYETIHVDILPVPIDASIAMTAADVGNVTTITWTVDFDADRLPSSYEPIDYYELRVYDCSIYDSLQSEDDRYLTYILSTATGSKTMMVQTMRSLPLSPALIQQTAAIYAIGTQGGAERIAHTQIDCIMAPPTTAATPPEQYVYPQDLTGTFRLNALPGMTGYTTVMLNVTYAQYVSGTWQYHTTLVNAYGASTQKVLDGQTVREVSYTIPEGTFTVQNAYNVPVTMRLELSGPTVGYREYEANAWVVMPDLVAPAAVWKNAQSGRVITTGTTGTGMVLYINAGSLTTEQIGYDEYRVFVYRYDPVFDTYSPYDINDDGYQPVMTGPMSSMAAPVAYQTVTVPQAGKYAGVVFLYDTDGNATPVSIAEATITVNDNWMTIDTGANTTGDIFGIAGDAIKLVFGMLLVLACAAIPPVLLGNTQPMAIIIGGVTGVVIGFALGLIPFWILLLLGVGAIGVVILNVRGGNGNMGEGDAS